MSQFEQIVWYNMVHGGFGPFVQCMRHAARRAIRVPAAALPCSSSSQTSRVVVPSSSIALEAAECRRADGVLGRENDG